MTNLDGLSFCGQGLQSSVALVFAMAGKERQNKRSDVRIRHKSSEQQRQKGSDQKREEGRGQGLT